MGSRQAQFGKALLTAFQHPVQCGQVFAVFDGVPGAFEDMFHRVVRERLQPQFLDLPQLLRVRERGVVLVVVVEPEQGEYLVQSFDMPLGSQAAVTVTRPRRCR